MALISRDTGCCGANFEREEISIIGLLTISMPYFLLYIVLWPVLFLLRLAAPPLRPFLRVLRVIFEANVKAVADSRIFPRVKCSLSGKLFRISPFLSGLAFRWFNFAVLGMIWLVVIGLAVGVHALVF
jgi:hypothetical protein